MSPVEQRKVLCSITFHVVAITCVVWSLYVLIERTAEEMRNGVLEWPFWTKLVVVAIGKDLLLPTITDGFAFLLTSLLVLPNERNIITLLIITLPVFV